MDIIEKQLSDDNRVIVIHYISNEPFSVCDFSTRIFIFVKLGETSIEKYKLWVT